MSVMTKFLKQVCQLQAYQRDSQDEPVLNDFGELQYEEAISCKCRREQIVQDVYSTNGAILRASTRYYLDDSVEIFADYKIDGRIVMSVQSYVDQVGAVIGYEVYVE